MSQAKVATPAAVAEEVDTPLLPRRTTRSSSVKKPVDATHDVLFSGDEEEPADDEAVDDSYFYSAPVDEPEDEDNHLEAWKVASACGLLSFLAIPLLYGLNATSIVQDPTMLMIVGVAVLIGYPMLVHLIVFRNMPTSQYDTYMLIFSLFAFTSMIDLILALTIDNRLTVFAW